MEPGERPVVVYLDSIDERLLDELTRMTGCTAPLFPSQGTGGRALATTAAKDHQALERSRSARVTSRAVVIDRDGPVRLSRPSERATPIACSRRLRFSNHAQEGGLACPPGLLS